MKFPFLHHNPNFTYPVFQCRFRCPAVCQIHKITFQSIFTISVNHKFCRKCRKYFIDINTFLKLFPVCLIHPAVNAGIIFFINMLFWRKQTMMKTAVICDQKKSYGIFIQPSYRRQILAPPFSKKIQYCFLIPVFRRRDDTCRFIQHIVFITKIGYRFSCKNNLIIFIDHKTGIRYLFSVDLYCALSYVPFQFRPRTHIHIGKKFVQPHNILLICISSAISIIQEQKKSNHIMPASHSKNPPCE